jgi:tryptophan-rich sensory protein
MKRLLGWLALVAAAAALGGFASRDAASFYAQLARPTWAPPASWFGPVWSALYLMMGVAAWRISGHPHTRPMLTLFAVQLAVNALWSWLFFAFHLGAASFADIVLLDILVFSMVITFWHVDKPAALLVLPYLAWIAFATALNWAVWRGNPGALG